MAYSDMTQQAGINIRITETGAAATTAKIKSLNTSIGKTALAMVGAGSAIVVAHQAISKMSQVVGESIERFREFEYRMAEVSTILDEMGTQAIIS